jgi:hypothetical protein
MELGEPRVTVAVLCDLDRLLVDWRLRDDSEIRHRRALQGMNAARRARVITHLANLLIQAASVAIGKGSDDDER